MNTYRLQQLLYEETDIEKIQKKKHNFIIDLPKYSFSYQNGLLTLNDTSFFKKNEYLFINKHNRYAACPKHCYQFIELNYMFSGKCTEKINGEKIDLKKGDILFLNAGSMHAISSLGKNDILITFLIKEKNIKVDLLSQTKGFLNISMENITPFFTDIFRDKQYHVFRNNEPLSFEQTLNNIIYEYYFPQIYSAEIIKCNLLKFFLLTARRSEKNCPDSQLEPHNSILLSQITEEINKNFKSLTLAAIAQKLNYNKNYISNFIKNQTGKTFTELINIRRVAEANKLIKHTSYSIAQISELVGFSSKTYFYSEYKKHFDHLPSYDRQYSAAEFLKV
jgi:AraC-like DNA-binding protein